MMTKTPIRLAIVACLSLGSWSVAAQTGLAPDINTEMGAFEESTGSAVAAIGRTPFR
jgi:hypothetical protein